MADTPLEELIAGYVRYGVAVNRGNPKPADELCAAEAEVKRLLWWGPTEAVWELVLGVLAAAPDDDLGFFAAGLLEEMVCLRGAELVDRIERRAAADARFHWALECIWLSEGQLPPDVQERIVKASGHAILLLPPLEPQTDEETLAALEAMTEEGDAPDRR